jgi:hypothetical protein
MRLDGSRLLLQRRRLSSRSGGVPSAALAGEIGVCYGSGRARRMSLHLLLAAAAIGMFSRPQSLSGRSLTRHAPSHVLLGALAHRGVASAAQRGLISETHSRLCAPHGRRQRRHLIASAIASPLTSPPPPVLPLLPLPPPLPPPPLLSLQPARLHGAPHEPQRAVRRGHQRWRRVTACGPPRAAICGCALAANTGACAAATGSGRYGVGGAGGAAAGRANGRQRSRQRVGVAG